MTGYFEVGRLTFSLNIEDGSSLWLRLVNYEPFKREVPGNLIFSVDVFDHQMSEDALKAKSVVFDAPAEDPMAPKIAIYRIDTKWLFELAPNQRYPICVRILCSEDFSKAELYMDDMRKMGRFAVDNATMLLYAFRTAGMHTLAMHASVTVKDGKGYLFLGRSGTGKSTHSSLWLKYIDGTWLLNDDNPVVRICDDGIIRVFGTPWSGKTPCYRDKYAPVGAFVQLRQAPANSIRRYKPLETYTALYASSSGYKDYEVIADGLHETMEKVAVTIPGFILDCLPDEAAAKMCYENVTQRD